MSHDRKLERIMYSIEEVTKMTSLGRNTILHEIESGRLPSLKIRSRRVVCAEDLKAWIDTVREEQRQPVAA